ncbi:hypothetical protein BpHYR1_040395, partial [Brachionus plicatilis]
MVFKKQSIRKMILLIFSQLLLSICLKKTAGLECNDICIGTGSSSKNCFCDHCDHFDDCCQNQLPKSVEPSLYECNSKLSDHHFIYT